MSQCVFEHKRHGEIWYCIQNAGHAGAHVDAGGYSAGEWMERPQHYRRGSPKLSRAALESRLRRAEAALEAAREVLAVTGEHNDERPECEECMARKALRDALRVYDQEPK